MRRKCGWRTAWVVVGLAAAALWPAAAQNASPQRPRITGISHAAYFVSNLPRALEFWHGLLGFDEYTTLNPRGVADAPQPWIVFLKINDRQHIELFTDAPAQPPNHLNHICLSVENAEQMRRYLQSKGIAVPAAVPKTRTGDYAFEVTDPDGTRVEFVQALPDGIEAQDRGKFLPTARIADAIYHTGILVGNLDKSLAFYEGVLGFTETWRGASNPNQLSWVNLRVPDGSDYIELMLYRERPQSFGVSNHVSLVVPDVQKALAELEARPAYRQYLTWAKPPAAQVGKNGKRQVNLFDPDGTRVELMEAQTVDGKPRPSSTAPPPPPAHP